MPPAAAAPVNGMAIASLACAIAGWMIVPLLGQILALVFGYSARKQIAATGAGGSGLATAGIVASWVFLILLAVVTAGFVVILVVASTHMS